MAETQPSVRVVKTFTYRGDTAREFSNRYHFSGNDTPTNTEWHDLFDALVLLEKTLYYGECRITGVLGYEPGSQVAVASQTYNVSGTVDFGSGQFAPGDCAAVLRMGTTKRSKKNHPVYVFSYYHGAIIDEEGFRGDKLHAAQLSAVTNYATDWLNGLVVGAKTYKRTTPDGHATTGVLVDQWIGHRDFLK